MRHFDVAIVGAGHSGAQAAILLRQMGFDGTIGLIGAEPGFPYERPPLSKDYLAGEKAFERMLIRPLAFWEERRVEMLPGRHIVAVDPDGRTVTAANGETFGYGSLIWAAGGSARQLQCAGGDLDGVHVIRSLADVDGIKARLDDVHRAVVVGGGYVGLEVAAVLCGLGRDVVLVEAMDRVLNRVAGEPISRFYEAEHRARGVDVRLGRSVSAIKGGERAEGVRLEDGEPIPADLVVVGIGIAAEVEPLLAAGCDGSDGVDVDAYCRTSAPGIYAIGDCARHANLFAGGAQIRLESVQNAHDQAATAVKAILGSPEPYAAMPWFWSNQYDLKLQTVGLMHGHDATILRGEPTSRSFSLIYLRQGRVVALDCVNATKDYAQGRKLILSGAAPDPAKLADPAIPLKELA